MPLAMLAKCCLPVGHRGALGYEAGDLDGRTAGNHKARAMQYAKASKGPKGVLADNLCTAMGWCRVNARRQLIAAAGRKASPIPLPRRRARRYSPALRSALERISTLSGEPRGKY